MLVLGVDTSGREGSLALARVGAGSFAVLEVVSLAGRQYSAEFVPKLSDVLARHGVAKDQVDAYAVASGPGSFTGLRVGLSAVKGLAEIFGKPIAAVSVLETMAAAVRQPGTVMCAIDAGRREVFFGEYVVGESPVPSCLREELVSYEEFGQLLDANPSRLLITPDATITELCRFHTQVTHVERPQADAIAQVGALKIESGQTSTAEALDANYIRRSDAEIFAKK